MLARGKLGKIAAAAEHRFNVAVELRLFNYALHVVVNSAVMRKIAFYILLCFLVGNSDVLCERVGSYSVDYSEVYRLCAASHNRSDHIERQVEHLRGCDRVDIVAVLEGGYHVFVLSDMGEHPQLDLRVVRVNEHPVLTRAEEFAHFLAKLGADGNILQIRLR